MGSSRSNKPFYENVAIIDVAAEGNAIAKVDDVVIFIKNVVPGDVVDIQVTKKGNVIARPGLSILRVIHPTGLPLFVLILVFVVVASGKTFHIKNNFFINKNRLSIS